MSKENIDLEKLTIEQIADIDLESDKAQEEKTPLLTIKRRLRSGVRAGGPRPIGLARQK